MDAAVNIETARKELKERQDAVVKEINEVTAQVQALTQRRQALILEAERLNGENRMLNRLSDNGKSRKSK